MNISIQWELTNYQLSKEVRYFFIQMFRRLKLFFVNNVRAHVTAE